MRYTAGRDNLAITVHVPNACKNNCEFCNVKEIYNDGSNALDVFTACTKLADTTVEEVVISGGEPTQDLGMLLALVMLFPNKDVYINTCLPKEAVEGFAEITNKLDNVKGVNISRHGNTIEDDREILRDIAEDKELLAIHKPVRINVVLTDKTDIPAILDRWEEYPFTINFRQDYRKTTQATLNTLEGIPNALMKKQMLGVNRCSVCQTITFDGGNKNILFHKGLCNTSIQSGDSIEVNDVVVYPDGSICFDWDKQKLLDDHCFLRKQHISPSQLKVHTGLVYGAMNNYCGGYGGRC